MATKCIVYSLNFTTASLLMTSSDTPLCVDDVSSACGKDIQPQLLSYIIKVPLT